MISVVLATHNEEKNLAQCLHSIKSLADEIILADGESSDRTLEIAQAFKARIIKTTNKANFHINKQLAMDAAQGELVLQLDADEVVDTGLAHFIENLHQEILKNKKSQDGAVAWNLRRKNLFLGKFLTKGGQYPDPVIRLYVAGKARLPQKDVHEQMIVDGKVGTAEGHLLHYSNPTFDDYLRKFQTYTTFKAQQLKTDQVPISASTGINYLLWKPLVTFFQLFFRHKGFVDGIPGFVFAVFSGLHHSVAYLKLWELSQAPVSPSNI